MPIQYEVDREKRLMITRATGQLTPSELFSYLDAIIADPANEQCDEIYLFDDVDLSQVSSADVRTLARRAAEVSSGDPFRVAFVAPRDADFGMVRMFQAFRELGDDRMAVFRTLDDACDWLGVKVA